MTSPIPVVIRGAAGRMGQAIARVVSERGDLALVAALVRSGSALVDAPVYPATDHPLRYADTLTRAPDGAVLVDFSVAEAFDDGLAMAVDQRLAFVSGTTGLDARQFAALERAAESIPVLWSANFSLGVAVLTRVVRDAARAVPDWDCEIVEAHHSRKLDAPSGTALALGRAVAAARGQDFDAVAVPARTGGDAARRPAQIGFAAVRGGDIVGEHTVLFATAGERIELSHRATDRAIFARGAVTSAAWLAGRAPGRYSIEDVVFA